MLPHREVVYTHGVFFENNGCFIFEETNPYTKLHYENFTNCYRITNDYYWF